MISTRGIDEKRRVYMIRQAAYRVLRDWGVEVEKPVLELPAGS